MNTDIGNDAGGGAHVRAMIWKESRELWRQGSSWQSILMRLGVLGAGGVAASWRFGAEYGHSWMSVAMIGALVILPVLPIIPDSFAGERERHTLETLLATHIRERDVFIGKVGAAVLFGLIFAIVVVGVSLAIAAVRFSGLELHGADWARPALGLAIGVLAAGVVSGVGAIVSAWASTVRDATQRLVYLLIGVVFLAPLAMRQLPEPWLTSASRWVADHGAMGVIGVIAVVLLAGCAATFAIAGRRFTRARLLLGK